MKERLIIHALKQNHIPYELVIHSQTFSSMKTAQATHTKGIEFAKPIMINVDGEMVMAVLPANYTLDLKKIKESMGAKNVYLATEAEFSPIFSDSVIGAMPAMGNLYGLNVIMDKDMMDDTNIAFNACNHQEIIKMKFSDYKKMVHPRFTNIHRSPDQSLKCY